MKVKNSSLSSDILEIIPESDKSYNIMELSNSTNGACSHDEIIFDKLNEIPQYFDEEVKIKEGKSKFAHSKEKNSNFSCKENKLDIDLTKCVNADNNPSSKLSHSFIPYTLLKNEKILQREEAYYISHIGNHGGIASISDFRFNFNFYEDNTEDKLGLSKETFSIPIYMIAK